MSKFKIETGRIVSAGKSNKSNTPKVKKPPPKVVITGGVRTDMIEKCKECDGNPETTKCKLHNMEVEYCIKCMEVVKWNKI